MHTCQDRFLAQALRKVRELKEKVRLLNSGKLFDRGTEKELLLSDIDEGDFYKFLGGFEAFLKRIVVSLEHKA